MRSPEADSGSSHHANYYLLVVSARAPIGNTENTLMYIWSKQANNYISSGAGRPSDEPPAAAAAADGKTTETQTHTRARLHLILICIWNNLRTRLTRVWFALAAIATHYIYLPPASTISAAAMNADEQIIQTICRLSPSNPRGRLTFAHIERVPICYAVKLQPLISAHSVINWDGAFFPFSQLESRSKHDKI